MLDKLIFKCSNFQMFKYSNVKCQVSYVIYQMSIILNFCRSVPPEILRLFLVLVTSSSEQFVHIKLLTSTSSKDAHLSFSKFCADGSVLFITNSISSSRRLISQLLYVRTLYVYKGLTGVFHLRFFHPNLYLYMGTLVKRGHLIKELMGSFIFSFSSHMATKLSDLSSPSFSSSHPFLI